MESWAFATRPTAQLTQRAAGHELLNPGSVERKDNGIPVASMQADPAEHTGAKLVWNNQDMLDATIHQGPGLSQLIDVVNASSILVKFQSARVAKIDGYFVDYAPRQLVLALWAKARNESGNHTITLLEAAGNTDSHRHVLIALGILPAMVSICAATCALPILMCRHVCRQATFEVPTETGTAAFVSDTMERRGRWVQRNIRTPFEQIEKALQVDMEPAQKLQSSVFTRLVIAQYLWPLIILFHAGNCCLVAIVDLQFVRIAPETVLVDTMSNFLGLLESIFLWYGLQRAEASSLVAPGAFCPSDAHVKLETVLEKHLFWKTVMPYSVDLVFIAASGFTLSHRVVMHVFSTFYDEQYVPHLFSLIWTLNKFLVKMAFFRFMLDVSVLARTAKMHVEGVTGTVFTVHKQVSQETADMRKGRLDSDRMELLHGYIVKLDVVILPCLEAIGSPAVLSVLCSIMHAIMEALKFLTLSNFSLFLVATWTFRVFIELLAVLCLLPLTEVSTACDELRKEVSTLKAVCSPDEFKGIQMTESYMTAANNGQGLGFVMFGTGLVVNRRLLVSISLKILAYGSIAFGIARQFIERQQDLTTSHAA